MVSRVSSFYNWARKIKGLAERLPINPVDAARPKAPKPYQSESTNSLGDEELNKLIGVVKAKADAGEIVGKRDYALLLHYILTGRRREEVIRLRWGDIKINETLIITYRVKSGRLETREIKSHLVKATLLDYLETSGRLESMEQDSPLWTRHDRAGNPGPPLTSHAFVKNLKRAAAEADIPNFHLHRLRHTFARQAGDETGNISEVQEALGHQDQATTRIYLERVGLKRDRLSERLAERLGLQKGGSSI
jgi:integrase